MAGATGAGPVLGPCEAYADWDQVEACCGGLAPIDGPDQDALLAAATEVIWGLTGGRYSGECTRVFTPCNPGCVRAGSCCCSSGYWRLDLGSVPVWGAYLTVDGDDVEVSIEDFRYLVRMDGAGWPVCGVDWSVEYTYGWPVPVSIQMATARLACEYAKQCAGLPCGLDPRTTSYTRDGVSVTIADPGVIVAKGMTGIPFVDSILANPMHRRGGQIVDLAATPGGSTSWPL